MADTSIIEVARQTHEEVERYEQALVDMFLSDIRGHKDKLTKEHKASDLLDRIASRNRFLVDFYKDEDSSRKSELDALTSTEGSADQLSEFYSRLAKVKDYHRKYPDVMPDAFALDFSALEGNDVVTEGAGLDFVDRMFSGEESAGRFLDLYLQHEQFLNLKGVRRITYLQYLDDFDKVAGESSRISRETKKGEQYRKYFKDLRNYLSSFIRKTQPLTNVDELESKALSTFDADWEEGRVLGWEDKGVDAGKGKGKSVGPPAEGEGIWCEACQRSYSKQTVYDAHLTSKKHLKAAERLASAGPSNANGHAAAAKGPTPASSDPSNDTRVTKNKELARDETIVVALGQELKTLRAETKSNVERKQALTDKERQAEAEAEEQQPGQNGAQGPGGDEDEDDDDKIYNPLRLPLGWDGKPIPYWLYKLHGLGVEYKCEICSDYVYMGRKNFERHFQESRHAFGMRALGLPNTKHFHEITRIEDALSLAEKLKRQGKAEITQNDATEELEDADGNVYNRKTYELLQKQGLI